MCCVTVKQEDGELCVTNFLSKSVPYMNLFTTIEALVEINLTLLV